jgi:hypothetical protein
VTENLQPVIRMTVGDGKSRFTQVRRKQSHLWCHGLPLCNSQRLLRVLRGVSNGALRGGCGFSGALVVRLLLRGSLQRERHGKRGPLPDDAFHGDLSAMGGDNLLHDIQP